MSSSIIRYRDIFILLLFLHENASIYTLKIRIILIYHYDNIVFVKDFAWNDIFQTFYEVAGADFSWLNWKDTANYDFKHISVGSY